MYSRKNATRREILQQASRLTIAIPLLPALGCQSSDIPVSPDTNTIATPSTGQWAQGNTGLITAPYPSNDIFENTETCSAMLTRSDALGPCFYGVEDREDIAEGAAGLPMQLSLKIIDEQCQPVANADIDVWHCDVRGVYSGDTTTSASEATFNGSFCTGGDMAAQSQSWGRGKLTTNAEGRVDFKTIFPGWYPGRPVHIHFTVALAGARSLVSQLYFDDTFCQDICTKHPAYLDRGEPDTNLLRGASTDLSASRRTQLMNVRATAENTLQAYKTIRLEV